MVTLLSLLNAAAFTDRMVLGALAPVLQPALQLTDGQLGLVQGPAFGIAYGVALPFAGRMVDAIGGRRALLGSVLVWTLGLAVSASATGLGPLVAGRAITGIGQAALMPAAMALLLGAVAPARAGRTIALFTGAGTVGRGVAFVIAGILLGLIGSGGPIAPWSAVLLLLGMSNIMLLAIGRGIVSKAPDRSIRHHDTHAAFWRWLRSSPISIIALVVAALGAVVVVQGLAAWVATILVRQFAITPAAAGIAIGTIGIVAGPLGHMLGGYAVDRGGRLGRRHAGMTLLCIPAVLVFVDGDSLSIACAGLAATMLASGASATMGLIRIQQAIPAEARGTANGLFMTLVALVGISGGPTLVSLVAEKGVGVGVGLVLVVTGATLVAAFAVMVAGPVRGTA